MTKVLHLANYAFEVPAAIETRLEEDDTILVVEVPGRGGQVLCGEHDCAIAETAEELDRLLRNEALRFLECILKVRSEGVVGSSVEGGEESPLRYASLVVSLDAESTWVARLYGQVGLPSLVLVHWNGPTERVRSQILPLLCGVRSVGR